MTLGGQFFLSFSSTTQRCPVTEAGCAQGIFEADGETMSETGKDPCPGPDEIRAFLGEQLDAEQDRRLSVHIEQCERCSEAMTRLGDTAETLGDAELLPVLADMQSPPDAEPYESEDACQRAVERAEEIHKSSLSLLTNPDAKVPLGDGQHLTLLGPYEIDLQIGAGGMGTVYRAVHTKLMKTVAIKVLHRRRQHPETIARFEREMKLLGQLEHPNLVRATDANEEDGVHYLVMELIDGIDLSCLVRRVGQLSVADACEIVRQAAEGLQFAHQSGLVHRDVKPANIMLARASGNGDQQDGSVGVKVLDLGLASANESSEDEALTSTDHVMGTIDYMAPEQLDGTRNVDIRSDIYSLGATLYKLLTGHTPFSTGEQGSRIQKIKALATQEPTPVTTYRDDLPSGLVTIVNRLLNRAPSERYATPADAAEALLPHAMDADLTGLLAAAISDVEGEPAALLVGSPGVARHSVSSARRPPRSVVQLWAAFAVLAVVVVIVFINHNPASPPPASESLLVEKPTASIRLEDRMLVFEDLDGSADHFTVRANGKTLLLQREESVFTADIGEGDGSATFSIETSEFRGLRIAPGSGDDRVTLLDIKGVQGDLIIEADEGEDTIDVKGAVDIGAYSLTATAAQIIVHSDGRLTASSTGSIQLTAGKRIRSEREAAIQLRQGAVIQTERGGITLTGDASMHSFWPVHGVHMERATIETQSGAIALKGHASTGKGSSFIMGVGLHYGTIVRSTGTGKTAGRITLQGTGGYGARCNRGVNLENSSIESHDAEIHLTGTGGTSELRHRNDGVCLQNSTIASHSGDLRITGIGGLASGSNLGVALVTKAHLRTGGTGQIIVEGWGGRGEENNIGIDFGGLHPVDELSSIQTTLGDIALDGRAGEAVSRGVVIAGNIFATEGNVSISGTGANGAPDIHSFHGIIGNDNFQGDVTLTADSLHVEGGSVNTSGSVIVQTRTNVAVLEASPDDETANYIKADTWPMFSSRIGSLTVKDANDNIWHGKSIGGIWQYSHLVDGKAAVKMKGPLSLSISPARALASFLPRTFPFANSGQVLGFDSSTAATLGDIDSDGDLDAIVVNHRGPCQVWLNDSQGGFLLREDPETDGAELGKVALGDLDGDSDLDAVFVYKDRPVRVSLNEGSGTLTETDQQIGSGQHESAALGDLDGDMDLDLFIVRDGPDAVWLNEGNGEFRDSGQSYGESRTTFVVLSDVNGDNSLDAVIAGQGLRIWFNDGQGGFTDSGQQLGHAGNGAVALGDLNGDGYDDIFEACADFDSERRPNRVWMNQGKGTFVDSGQMLGRFISGDVVLHDFDGDEDLDAVVMNFAAPDEIWWNDGKGIFNDVLTFSKVADASSEVSLGDLNGDGEPDLFIANFNSRPNQVWLRIRPDLKNSSR